MCEVIVCVRRREEKEEKEPGIQNQKQEPHTKMWGTINHNDDDDNDDDGGGVIIWHKVWQLCSPFGYNRTPLWLRSMEKPRRALTGLGPSDLWDLYDVYTYIYTHCTLIHLYITKYYTYLHCVKYILWYYTLCIFTLYIYTYTLYYYITVQYRMRLSSTCSRCKLLIDHYFPNINHCHLKIPHPILYTSKRLHI